LTAGVLGLAAAGSPRRGSSDGIGRWRTEAGRRAYLAAYARLLQQVPAPTRTDDVPTGYGTVCAYTWYSPETADRIPVLLLPGWGAPATMWKPYLSLLPAGRPVIAVDALGDAGLSVQTAPIITGWEQADWIVQTLDGLSVEKVFVVGHSFGGYTAANLALRAPGRVAGVGLLEPVVTFTRMPLSVIWKSIPSALPFLPQSWRDKALESIGGAPVDRSDPMTAVIAAGTQHYKPVRATPKPFSQEQLESLQVPVWAVMARQSTVTNAEAAVDNARAHVPDIRIEACEGTHSLPFEQPERISACLTEFMDAHDPAAAG